MEVRALTCMECPNPNEGRPQLELGMDRLGSLSTTFQESLITVDTVCIWLRYDSLRSPIAITQDPAENSHLSPAPDPPLLRLHPPFSS